MISDREKQIGARVKAFREAIQVSRSKFSVSCGFGSERIASYESGRAPLPYSVFKAISNRYFLSPFWLAIGPDGGSPRLNLPHDDSPFAQQVPERSPFTWVYDKFISDSLKPLRAKEMQEAEKFRMSVKELVSRLKEQPDVAKNLDGLLALKRWLESTGEDLALRINVARGENVQKKDLTLYPHEGNTSGVKPILPRLIERLKRATEERGRKTELASWLGVSPQKVTDWLSERVEPSGENTLRLLHWVEQQERQK